MFFLRWKCHITFDCTYQGNDQALLNEKNDLRWGYNHIIVIFILLVKILSARGKKWGIFIKSSRNIKSVCTHKFFFILLRHMQKSSLFLTTHFINMFINAILNFHFSIYQLVEEYHIMLHNSICFSHFVCDTCSLYSYYLFTEFHVLRYVGRWCSLSLRRLRNTIGNQHAIVIKDPESESNCRLK